MGGVYLPLLQLSTLVLGLLAYKWKQLLSVQEQSIKVMMEGKEMEDKALQHVQWQCEMDVYRECETPRFLPFSSFFSSGMSALTSSSSSSRSRETMTQQQQQEDNDPILLLFPSLVDSLVQEWMRPFSSITSQMEQQQPPQSHTWLFISTPDAESEPVSVVKQPQAEPAVPVEQPQIAVTENKAEDDVVVFDEELPPVVQAPLEPQQVGQQVQEFWLAEEDEALTPQRRRRLSEVTTPAARPCPGRQRRALYTPSQCLLQAWKEQRVSAACSQAFHALQETRTQQLQTHLQYFASAQHLEQQVVAIYATALLMLLALVWVARQRRRGKARAPRPAKAATPDPLWLTLWSAAVLQCTFVLTAMMLWTVSISPLILFPVGFMLVWTAVEYKEQTKEAKKVAKKTVAGDVDMCVCCCCGGDLVMADGTCCACCQGTGVCRPECAQCCGGGGSCCGGKSKTKKEVVKAAACTCCCCGGKMILADGSCCACCQGTGICRPECAQCCGGGSCCGTKTKKDVKAGCCSCCCCGGGSCCSKGCCGGKTQATKATMTGCNTCCAGTCCGNCACCGGAGGTCSGCGQNASSCCCCKNNNKPFVLDLYEPFPIIQIV